MSRVIAVMACGFTLAACSSSLPSFDFFKSAPTTETLRIESEPPGADAKTAEGQTCRTPCELSVASGTDTSVTVAMNGYQPQTVPLHAELVASAGSDSNGSPRLQPNPIYVELQPATPPRPAKKRAAVKKKSASAVARSAPAETQEPATSNNSAFPNPADYPWPQPR